MNLIKEKQHKICLAKPNEIFYSGKKSILNASSYEQSTDVCCRKADNL